MTQQEFNQMLAVAIAGGLGGGTYISRWSGEEIDTGISKLLLPGGILTPDLSDGAVTWPKLAPEVQLDHRNLLDNWYFIGGGSQQGGGQFPINQRGLTEYTGDYVYSIDRWKINNIKYNVSNNIITITGSPENANFFQLIKNGLPKNNMLYTFSFLSSSGLHSLTSDLSADAQVDIPYGKLILWHDGLCEVRFDKSAIGDEITPIAAKLELGPVQTLAHKDGDVWILNDAPPKFGAELAECQRHQVVYGSKQRFFGICTLDGNGGGQGILFVPVQLDKIPTIQGSLHIFNSVNNIDIDRFAIMGVGPTGVWINVSFAQTPDLSGGRLALIYSITDIVIDGNL